MITLWQSKVFWTIIAQAIIVSVVLYGCASAPLITPNFSNYAMCGASDCGKDPK